MSFINDERSSTSFFLVYRILFIPTVWEFYFKKQFYLQHWQFISSNWKDPRYLMTSPRQQGGVAAGRWNCRRPPSSSSQLPPPAFLRCGVLTMFEDRGGDSRWTPLDHLTSRPKNQQEWALKLNFSLDGWQWGRKQW